MNNKYKYIIIGAGIAGASAIEGIREYDRSGSILIAGEEESLPYKRPPLTKDIWWGTMRYGELFPRDEAFYSKLGAELRLSTRIVSLDAAEKTVTDDKGTVSGYDKLLIATGGEPRVLPVPGGRLEGICYYRKLKDYNRLQETVRPGTSVIIVGGGFIGAELAASLSLKGVSVTALFAGGYTDSQLLPEYLGRLIDREFSARDVRLINNDKPVAFKKNGGKYTTMTQRGVEIESDMVIAGIGIAASAGLAEQAGAKIRRYIVVDEYQRTTVADIFAAGDNTVFPYLALGREMHVEHWDHSLNHGWCAGRNMAGANIKYDHMPAFYTVCYGFTFNAVGEVSPALRNAAVWEKEGEAGTFYFMRGEKLCGILTCNLAERMDWAREEIRKGVLPENIKSSARAI